MRLASLRFIVFKLSLHESNVSQPKLASIRAPQYCSCLSSATRLTYPSWSTTRNISVSLGTIFSPSRLSCVAEFYDAWSGAQAPKPALVFLVTLHETPRRG